MKRCVCVVADAEKKNLSIEFIHPAHWALGDVRREGEWIRRDSGRLRSSRRERKGVIASQYTGQPPENIGYDSKVLGGWGGHQVEWFLVIPGPGWHHERAPPPQSLAESLDKAQRSSLDGPYRTE